MIALAVDENFDHHILRALLRRVPGLDALTVPAAGLAGADDPTVLAWAAREGRILLTHDVRTHDGVRLLGEIIGDLVLVLMCATPDDFRDRVFYVPLR